MMKNMKKKIKLIPSEAEVQNAVCEYLERKRRFFWRQNTTGLYDPIKKSFRKMPKYAMKGVADVIVITDGGYAVFLEIKRQGEKLRPEQKVFQELCNKVGAEYHVITSVDQLKPLGL